jgi:Domain of unknown function (DUF4249)
MKISFKNINKKQILLFIPVLLLSMFMMSCTDVITLDVAKSDPYLVVDGSVTNLAGEQVIKLTKSQNLLDKSVPEGVKNASVKVTDNLGKVYEFKDLKNDGKYVWKPVNSSEIMGVVGRTYSLEIKTDNEIYRAVSKLNRVPKIDSIVYKYSEATIRQRGTGKPDKGYDAQFYALDPKGLGDCYQIKVYKNGILYNSADRIVTSYDAIGGKTTIGDGIVFVSSIRNSITDVELVNEKDKLKVELLSITEAHFDFWEQLITELNNAGLFATPASRISTNVDNINSKSTKKASGWFGTSAISSMEVIIDKNKAVKEFND